MTETYACATSADCAVGFGCIEKACVFIIQAYDATATDGSAQVDVTADAKAAPPDTSHTSTPCTKKQETCNGKDDDCNGKVDDVQKCSDGDTCTTNDLCVNGKCTGSPVPCDDGLACTDDACLAGTCTHIAFPGPCNDGNACTTNDVCVGATCAGAAKSCDDGNTCTADGCDSLTGKCVAQVLDNGVLCDDDDLCTSDTRCVAGSCSGGQPLNCEDGNACTVGLCSGGKCNQSNYNGLCDDKDACTVGDQCFNGSCQGKAMNCNDGNSCTHDSCSGGKCQSVNLNSLCNDGYPCTTKDLCVSGTCQGTPIVCDDGNPCTTDSCWANGCKYTPTAQPCDDGSVCTKEDTCSATGCKGKSISCDDGNVCTADICSSISGCLWDTTELEGSPCTDGSACTIEACSQGVCATKPLACGENASCEAATGCACNPGFVKTDGNCSCPTTSVHMTVNGVGICVVDWPSWGPRPVDPSSLLVDKGGGMVTDGQNGLSWQKMHSALPTGATFSEALAYCEQLALAGAFDWRAPTLAELLTTVNYAKTYPATPTSLQANTLSSLWSASAAADKSAAWAVSSATGQFTLQSTATQLQVRCVRGTAINVVTGPRFVVNAPSGVTLDKATKLTWQFNVPQQGQLVTATEAEQLCKAFQVGGIPMRLPTVAEITTLMDRSQAKTGLLIDGTAFFLADNTSLPFWTSTAVAESPAAGNVWLGNFLAAGPGLMWGQASSKAAAIRCVR